MHSGKYYEKFPGNPDIQAAIRMDGIRRVQSWRHKLLSVNSRHTENMLDHNLPTTEQYLIRASANSAVPAPHDRYVLEPRLRYPVIEHVSQLRVRVPLIEVLDHLDESTEELPTTDACFELVHSDKARRPARFLLNAAGFWPYFDATDLVPNTDIDIPGMFAIPSALNDPRDYQVLELINELLVAYRPRQVDNRPADVA